MRLTLWITGMVAVSAMTINLHTQTRGNVNLHVQDTAGIRRGNYPVNARVPFPKGVLNDPAHVRLTLDAKEVPAQIATESQWPDKSVQWLAVDFNVVAIGPMENQTYHVEYGDDVSATPVTRGLSVTETAEAIQVGNVRLNKKGAPLVSSVRYRQEDIGVGPNGFAVTDDAGVSHDLTSAELVTEIVKPGPLYVVVRYSGRVTIGENVSVPFTITAEMPTGKTWAKYTAQVQGSTRLREISFTTPFAFAEFPWLWDFGTGSWSYGVLRGPTESVTLTQTVKPGANDWQIKTGVAGQEQPYEVAGGTRPKLAEGWGHFQDAKEVIAFGFDGFARRPGTYTIRLDGQGQAAFRFSPAQPTSSNQITIYHHYVASPTPVGAVTGPVSMLNSLTAACDRSQYVRSGVPPPPDAVVSGK